MSVARQTGLEILLVEDHAQLRRILTRALEEHGFKVTAVSCGEDARALLEQGSEPALLFSDVRMPGHRSGLELAQWARENRPRMRILLQTGYADLPTDHFNVLRKPFSDAELLAALHKALGT